LIWSDGGGEDTIEGVLTRLRVCAVYGICEIVVNQLSKMGTPVCAVYRS